MKRSAIAIALISLLSGPLMARAQGVTSDQTPSDVGKDRSFLELDQNLDGHVTEDEARRHSLLSERFTEADSDGNGWVDVSEFSAFVATSEKSGKEAGTQAGGKMSFETLDVNKDGSLSQSEAQTDPTLSQQYGSVDQNSDGLISPAEFSAFESKKSGQPTAPGATQPMSFEQLDSNKDGMLARSEVEGGPLAQQFTGMDTNKDGQVSKQEYQASVGTGGTAGKVSFQSLDKNGNGWISPNEANADATISSQFSQMDQDKNGFLDQSEFSAWETSQGGGGTRGM